MDMEDQVVEEEQQAEEELLRKQHGGGEGVIHHKHSDGVTGMGGEPLLIPEEAEHEEKFMEEYTGETEYDLETVLAKQNTYNLFCPYCNSCITRRVILRPEHGDDADGRAVFRCLSCLGLFFGIGASYWDQARQLGIIKSIVYGGLIESVTSLGIVSSAAGGGASTLNTLALALANLFGGLFLIAHNLRELTNQQPSTTAAGETEDRYTELLGNRRHILLHATIVILSFIMFGAVAPVTYAFSFRKSDSRYYKLAAVAGASLFCILLLATGKAYVRRPPKTYLKTISYYLGMGVTGSAIPFLVGELFDYLLQKLGWFSSTSSVSGPWLVSVPTQSRTASY